VSVHLTEEEQLEVLKRWWKDYGRTVLLAAVIAIGGYFGFTTWQEHQRQQAENASEIYDQLIKLADFTPGKTLSEADRATFNHLAQELKDGDSKSMYAHSAAFFLAKLAVMDEKLDEAAAELKWVLSAKPEVATEQLARLRLARVLTAQKSYADAMAQLSVEPAAAFASDYAEARGDILKAQGDLAAARTAYEQALSTNDPQQQERHMLLQMKVDDLKVADASPVPATPAVEESAQ
jgi:predicted negative regulator of RcsB-dependent stress response